MFKVRGRVVLVMSIFFLLLFFQLAIAQPFNFETATLGATGQFLGDNVDGSQFVGAKFTVSDFVRVTSVGGHVTADTNPLFVAINPLNVVTGLPNNTSLSDAIFATTFDAPYPSGQVTITTDFCLPPGRYSIMMGAGLFGATGYGAMPDDNTDIGSPQYFFLQNGFWYNGVIDNVRFFVNGSSDSTCAAVTNPPPCNCYDVTWNELDNWGPQGNNVLLCFLPNNQGRYGGFCAQSGGLSLVFDDPVQALGYNPLSGGYLKFRDSRLTVLNGIWNCDGERYKLSGRITARSNCPPYTCIDGIQDGSETDVDCGGSTCIPCIDGKHCNANSDCFSDYCVAGVCAPD
jgi:hypothetical protein